MSPRVATGTGMRLEQDAEIAADPAIEVVLWHQWRDASDEMARQRLSLHYLPYARTVAATYYARRMHDEIEFAEYLQFASLGMMEAMDRYDPAHGVQFKTFAARRMHGAILDGITRLTEKQQQIAVQQRLRKERLDEAKEHAGEAPAGSGDRLFGYLAEVGIGLAISYLLEGTGMIDAEALPETVQEYDSPYRRVELEQLRRRLGEVVSRLNDQQRTVIRYHYLQQHPFDEIAQMMNLTKGRISQVHRQALQALREQLGTRSHCDVSW